MEDGSFTSEKVLGQWLKELTSLEGFRAQAELEKRLITSYTQRLQSLDLKSTRLEVEYTTVRSKLDALKEMQSLRERFIQEGNKRDPA